MGRFRRGQAHNIRVLRAVTIEAFVGNRFPAGAAFFVIGVVVRVAAFKKRIVYAAGRRRLLFFRLGGAQSVVIGGFAVLAAVVGFPTAHAGSGRGSGLFARAAEHVGVLRTFGVLVFVGDSASAPNAFGGFFACGFYRADQLAVHFGQLLFGKLLALQTICRLGKYGHGYD